MSGSADDVIAEPEGQLEGAERALSCIGRLIDQEADRVAPRMDRPASQLLDRMGRSSDTAACAWSASISYPLLPEIVE